MCNFVLKFGVCMELFASFSNWLYIVILVLCWLIQRALRIAGFRCD